LRSCEREPLDGRSVTTVAKYRHLVKPVLERIGRTTLRDLTANDVRQALAALAEDRSSATVAIAHNALTRMIRHAEGRDLVRRNVAGHSSARTTEVIYRRELRPALTRGAEAMDTIFGLSEQAGKRPS
jgi:hypothetical protein